MYVAGCIWVSILVYRVYVEIAECIHAGVARFHRKLEQVMVVISRSFIQHCRPECITLTYPS